MPSVSLTGSDTVQIDDRVLADLADADAGVVDYPDDLAAVKTSKNGNAVFAFNESGRKVNVTLRVLIGSADDKWLRSRLQGMKNDFSAFDLLTGFLVKRTGDGQGNVASVVYQLAGGFFQKQPGAKTNAEGDTEQSVAVYLLTFANGDSSVQ